ncbi:fibronectin type III domain-containing protein [Limosilactobacillus portuensis]|uniref:Fibronectin type III domain-containing protein n=1 Tax=Limosilactobacillus portuensis TaxID=2742601 RepID=A0ABS6IWV5_9LACO|nr:fibronectin type III domain-containing protein [Limosilactobacillus portuensis]MBU9696005.1 fibronectin type III domain-containing protein [Limosilactobacillus portuensis]
MQYRIRNGDQLIATVSNKQYQLTGLTPNTAYNLSVASFNGFRESPRANLTVKTRGIQVKVPVSLTTGATVSLVYLEYALGLVPIGTEPKGMFGGGNRQIIPAKVVSSTNGISTVEITNSFNLMSDGLTMKQLPDKSFGVFEGYKALYYKGD